MRRSYLYLLIALLLTLILILYHQIGGLRKPDISLTDRQALLMAGMAYEGRLSDPRWEALFIRTRELIRSDSLDGDLTIIWYNNPEENEGEARVFIGISPVSMEDNLPGMERRRIPMNGSVRAVMKAHALVMPRPARIIEKLRAFGSEQGLSLQDIVIEKYPEESLIITEIPVE